jgi:hypothetical protein
MCACRTYAEGSLGDAAATMRLADVGRYPTTR